MSVTAGSPPTSATTMEDVDRLVADLLATHPPASTPPTEFWGAQFDRGLAWVHFPEGRGGLGLDPLVQERIDEQLRVAATPNNLLVNMMGVGMAGPTILAHGTDELRDRLLRPAFSCEEIWCQMFSEPGAGSDLAALATRAVRDGDEWVVNGQKVWTTLAHVARWGLLLTRTDPEVPKHKGLTYFIIDMHTPGVEVRPLRQMTGDAEFNEVYFTDARIPDSQRLGAVGDGWRVALTTLMNERVTVGAMGKERRGQGDIRLAVDLWQERGMNDPARRDQLARLWIEGEILRLTNIRGQELRQKGDPGPEGAILKLAVGEFQQRLFTFIVHLLGAEGMLISDYEMRRPRFIGEGTLGADADLQKAFLAVRGTTIGGGTTDIGRNILGERVLGLPGEPRVDKDLPLESGTPVMTAPARAPLFDPYAIAGNDDPYPVYRELRDRHPVYRIPERDLWVLSRFADVDAVLRDPSTFSSANGVSLEATAEMVPLMISMDPPRHDQLRRLVSRAFTPKRVSDLEPRVRQLASQLFERMVDDTFDAMDLASAFPTMVIGELLGVPGDDHARFRAWVESAITIDPDELVADASARPNLVELLVYLQAVIDERRHTRRDDMISALLDAEVDGERLDGRELLGFTLLLLAAGFETTKNLIGNGVATLATRPALRAAMVADPGLLPAVVEEVLRYESPVSGLTRTTTTSVELHGATLAEGARVMILFGSANRDERAFATPDTFDPGRPADRHLAFGHGIHHCLGASLARLEARVAFEELVQRLPDYEVVEEERLRSPYIRGFASLTITRAGR